MSFKIGDEVIVADCGFLRKGVIEAFVLHPRYQNVVVIKSQDIFAKKLEFYYNIYKPFAQVTDKEVYVSFTVCDYQITGSDSLENLLKLLELHLEKVHNREKIILRS